MQGNAKSYASDHIEGGYNDRVISEKTIEVSGQIAELLREAAHLFSDGEPTNDKLAYAKLVEISDKLRLIAQTHWTALDGNRTLAKKLAKHMAQKD